MKGCGGATGSFFWFLHKQEEERVHSALARGPGTFVLKLSFPRGTELLHAVVIIIQYVSTD